MALNFNEIVEDFRRLNWQDPGTWPIIPKVVVLLAILAAVPVAGYFLDWQGQLETIDGGRSEEQRLKDSYVAKKRQAVNLDLHKQQLREIDTQFGALLRQLPNKSQMDALLVDINQAGLGRGLQFDLFKPAGRETQKEFYAELPIEVKVVGNYHDMGAFAADVGQGTGLRRLLRDADRPGPRVLLRVGRGGAALCGKGRATETRRCRRSVPACGTAG